jgi:two-component system response regulator AtoC
MTADAVDQMAQYRWPGNVRELQNCVERGVVMADGPKIGIEALPERIRDNDDPLDAVFHGDELSIKKMSRALERVLIRRALEKTDGNRTHASDLLEISHRTLLYKMEDYGLEDVGKDG